MADSVARIRITTKADRPKRRGWFRVGLVVWDRDEIGEVMSQPNEAYPIAQFRYKGEAWAYAQAVRTGNADEVLIW